MKLRLTWTDRIKKLTALSPLAKKERDAHPRADDHRTDTREEPRRRRRRRPDRRYTKSFRAADRLKLRTVYGYL